MEGKGKHTVVEEAERKFRIEHPLHWLAIRPDRRPNSLFGAFSSPVEALEHWYDREQLEEKIPLRPNTWKYKSNQRAVLHAWEKWHGIKDWGQIDNETLIRLGGRGLLRYYPSAEAAAHYLSHEDAPSSSSSSETDHTYWRDPAHVRDFLDRFRDEQRLLVPLDWAQVDLTILREAGGHGLLNEGSLYEHLVRTYPHEDWGRVRPALDPAFWEDMGNQRAFLDFLVRYYALDRPEELIGVTMARMMRVGGRALLQRYPSKLAMLREVYPECVWPSVDSHHEWKEPRRHREFLEYVERVYGMTSLEDWRQVTARAFRRLGGSRLLEQYGNLYQALRSIYGPQRVPDDALQVRPTANQGDLQRYEVRKRMADELQAHLNIQQPEDWYQVTPRMMNEISPRYHHALGPPARFLPELFPHHEWDPFRFPLPHSFWTEDVGHHLRLMEALARQRGVEDPVDWTQYLPDDLHDHPGARRCLMHYPSWLSLLLFTYPARRNDLLRAAPPRFWSDRGNVESFLQHVGQALDLHSKFHWYTLSRGLLLAHPGAEALLQHHGSLCAALRLARPTVDWHAEYFDEEDTRSPPVKYLQCAVRHLFAASPELPVECNFEWEGAAGERESVAVYLPRQRVLLGYHPAHWYASPVNPQERFAEWAQQDKARRQVWEQRGYRYVAFPHWDPLSPSSIRARLMGAGASDVENLIVNQGRPNLSLTSFIGPHYRKRSFS